jgi:hypothetical protein
VEVIRGTVIEAASAARGTAQANRMRDAKGGIAETLTIIANI